MAVEVQHLTKRYGAQAAVDDISFTAERGQVLGFLGPNGAGKSTTMKIATGFIPPSSGTVRIEGHDVREDPMAVRRVVGYLPEHNPLYLDQYVPEYLAFIGGLHGLRGETRTRRVSEMIGLVGLERERHKKIGALSKGYRQRVGLAQALIHDPAVLILDEPTTGLDPNQILEIRALIKRIGQDKTVIFSTHILQEVRAICDRVVIINRGKLVADAPVAELSQRAGNTRTAVAEFEVPLDLHRALRKLPGVTAVEPAAGTAASSFRVSAPTDPRAALSRLAAEQGWPLVGLRLEENSLEQIFQSLTGE
ncbi:MAG: gliding motility-associated ABC transporter ATP-binding subunit GldA [Hymenobacteraceae bacterium]|nr:gliding motility-associated ABC transporter ATP-binding subunit GldA [Hymenobacteraceae bacterium]